MRAREFIIEGRENYHGLNILLQQDEDEVFVKASAGGRELGHVLFVQDGEYLMPQDLEVDERYRGQGIAQTMYDYVKSRGYNIRRSGQQTDAGAGFWAKHRPEQNVWEQGMGESLTKDRNLSAATRKYIRDHEWKLTMVDPQNLDLDSLDDPFNRVIDIDTDHPTNLQDPIIVHANGTTIIDGFHRAYQAQRQGLDKIPAWVPVQPGMAEGKITLSTDPNWYGATVDNYKATGPVVDIPADKLVGFEPDDKMNQPKSKANVKKIVAGLKRGHKLPPLLVRKYKNGYQVLDGHHRFKAYKLLGVQLIPAQIVPARDIEEKGKQGVAESLDQPYPLTWEQSEHGDWDATTQLPDGTPLTIMFDHGTPYEVEVSFERSGSMEVTGGGDSQRVFATVLAAIKHYIQQIERPANLAFSATKEVDPDQKSTSRSKLYDRLVNRYASSLGYKAKTFDFGDRVSYLLTPLQNPSTQQAVAENKHASQYLSQIPMLTWKPVNRSVWNTIQDEGLDQEQQAPDHSDWVMASLSISPEHAQALQALDDDALEYFNRFDIDLKSQYPGLTDLIDYDTGTVTIVKPMSVTENFADGRNPQDKGDSARHGIPKHATIAQLEKIRSSKTASPRKKQLAHWQINMRRGRAKARR